jgi:hypothetical protein
MRRLLPGGYPLTIRENEAVGPSNQFYLLQLKLAGSK